MKSVAVGFFDGVHKGHQKILAGAKRALTFANHPLSLISREKAPRLIMRLEERLAAIRECGVEEVEAFEFTRDLAELEAEEFAARYLGERSVKVFCGENWHFGKGGRGDAQLLKELGYDVEVVPYAEYKGEKVSSTRIRKALEEGALAEANAMLGREYAVFGRVFSGKGKGRMIGYPTVNVRPVIESLVPRGVYAVSVNGVKAIANYGQAPTFGSDAWTESVWEIHFLSEPPSIEGSISLSVSAFIRDERKFDSVEDLQRQIKLDCAKIEA